MFLPDLSSRKRDKSLHFLAPHPGTTDGLKSAVVSVSAALADTVSEVQRLTSVNEEAARTSGRFSAQVAALQDDLLEVLYDRILNRLSVLPTSSHEDCTG